MSRYTLNRAFCWQCGHPLSKSPDGEPRFALVRVGDQDVKVHKICRQDALNYQHFDTTPVRFTREVSA